MKFSKLKMYKVVEMEHALCIINAEDNVKQALPLMKGPRAACIEYIDRYTHERERGDNSDKAIEHAHQEALKGAQIVDRVFVPKKGLHG